MLADSIGNVLDMICDLFNPNFFALGGSKRRVEATPSVIDHHDV
jgi:hypothetical protein